MSAYSTSKHCSDLDESLIYFTNLWIAAHATWSRAFKIKGYNGTFSQLKNDSTSMIQEFAAAKKNYLPQDCGDKASLWIGATIPAGLAIVAFFILICYCKIYGCCKNNHGDYQSIPWFAIINLIKNMYGIIEQVMKYIYKLSTLYSLAFFNFHSYFISKLPRCNSVPLQQSLYNKYF